MTRPDSITVSADVANAGSCPGTEVVDLYIRDLVASVAQPVRVLRGFRRVPLDRGEKQSVSFTLDADALALYDQRNRLVTEPGRFQVWIAPDSAHGVGGEFTLQ